MDVGFSGRNSSAVAIAPDAVRVMLDETASHEGREACGLLFGLDGSIREATLATNVSPEPHHRFEIDPAHLFDAQRRDRAGPLRLMGCWHSHPNGVQSPSKTDREGVTDMGWLWLIVAGGEVSAWKPTEEGFAPVALQVSAS